MTHYLPNLTQEYKVTGLTALTTYTIQVAAMTAKGQGQLSASTISSGVPPGQRRQETRHNFDFQKPTRLSSLGPKGTAEACQEICCHFFFFNFS